MKIVADERIAYVRDYFGGLGELVTRPGRAIDANDVRDADILLVRSITNVNQSLLENSRVKFVGSVTAGADHLDTVWMDQQAIAWSVAEGFNAPSVAEYIADVIAAIQTRGLLQGKGLRAAVIGVGNVGRLVADVLTSLQFEVVLCDPLRAEREANFISTPLEHIGDVDLVTLHVPLTTEGPHATAHFIEKTFLSRQKAECVLINASRGGVMCSDDLLQYGTHLHWCFDVWEHEPRIRADILGRALIATPHIAGYSLQSKRLGIEKIYHAAKRWHEELPVVTPLAGSLLKRVFNPFEITEKMHAMLQASDLIGSQFDALRDEFSLQWA